MEKIQFFDSKNELLSRGIMVGIHHFSADDSCA